MSLFEDVLEGAILVSAVRGLFEKDTYKTMHDMTDKLVDDTDHPVVQGMTSFAVGYIAGPGISVIFGAKALGQDISKLAVWSYDKARGLWSKDEPEAPAPNEEVPALEPVVCGGTNFAVDNAA